MGAAAVPAAIIGAGVIAGGASVIGSSTSAGAAKSAAEAQAQAANNASQATLDMYYNNQDMLQPFTQLGYEGAQGLTNALGIGPNASANPIQNQFQPTMAQLQSTPGYQFTLQQGLQATQNSFAAQGLQSSGSALKGAAQYSEGLASTTYQQQLQNYMAQNQQTYNMLTGVTGLGENAAGQVAGLGSSAVASSNNALLSGAAATAGGTVGAANAISAGIGGVGSAASNTGLLYALNNAGAFGTNNAFPNELAPGSPGGSG